MSEIDILIASYEETLNEYRRAVAVLTKSNTEANELVAALTRNSEILVEMTHVATDTLRELYKITSKYHPMILRGEADVEDVKECSNIVQRSLKHMKEYNRLRQYYEEIKANKVPKDLQQMLLYSVTENAK